MRVRCSQAFRLLSEAPFSLKSFKEGSQSWRKRRKKCIWVPKMRSTSGQKPSSVVFAITSSGAFQFTVTAKITTTAIVTCSAAIFPPSTVFKIDHKPAQLAGPAVTFLAMNTKLNPPWHTKFLRLQWTVNKNWRINVYGF